MFLNSFKIEINIDLEIVNNITEMKSTESQIINNEQSKANKKDKAKTPVVTSKSQSIQRNEAIDSNRTNNTNIIWCCWMDNSDTQNNNLCCDCDCDCDD